MNTQYTTTDQSPATKPISFLLNDLSKSPPKVDEWQMKVRPEELSMSKTARVMVHQTLGGAWVDNFGEGLPGIKIAGHTGWRGTSVDGKEDHGLRRIQDLHKTFYQEWFSKRADIARSGDNVEDIQLVFSDLLDGISWLCAPQAFVLKRGVANPLLYYYEINLAFLSQAPVKVLDKPQSPAADKGFLATVFASMDAALKKIKAFVDKIKNVADKVLAPLKNGVGALMAVAYQLNTLVRDTLETVNGAVSHVTQSLMDIASGLAFAVHHAVSSVLAITEFPGQIKAELMGVGSAFLNLACIFNNALKPQQQLPDLNDLYGASLCSSTAGGRPVSIYQDSNTFEQILLLDSGSVSMTDAARQALNGLVSRDATVPQPQAQLDQAAKAITDGLRF